MDNLRVSTITAIGHLFKNNIDLFQIYKNIDIDDKIKYIKYRELEKGIVIKKKKIKRDFFNQMTIHVYDGVKKNGGKVNIKLFNNGRIQMTGLILIEQGANIIKLLQKLLKDNKDIELVEENKVNLEVVLINSDFDYGKSVDCDKLYQYLLENNIYVTYESCIYPGVNIKYFYLNDNTTGICKCCEQCDGKGDGINKCKKVTIAVFHSGKVIITGGRSFDQIEKSYYFIIKNLNEIFKNNRLEID